MKRVWVGLAMAIGLASITAGGIVISNGGGAPAGTANLWVDTNGGSCTYHASPAAYVDGEACSTVDAAWDAMSAGDTTRIVDGTYAPQRTDGDKSSETFVIGESKAGVHFEGTAQLCGVEFASSSAFCAKAANLTLENITLDAGDNHGTANDARIWVGATNVTFRNVDMWAEFPSLLIREGTFTWDGGSHGEDGVTPPALGCPAPGAGQPITIEGVDNVTLNGIRFNLKLTDETGCAPGDEPHLENIRIEGDADNVTISNNWFTEGSDVGSGHIYVSGGGAGVNNLKIINNTFEPLGGSYWIQATTNECDWTVAYNTFVEEGGLFGCTAMTWLGNLGVSAAYPGCSGTHTKNVWGTTGSCGTDTFVGGTSLDLTADGHLGGSSPAIDAAETPGVSDACTDSAIVNSRDRDGDLRPVNSVCDAGSDEYGG
jgi:hypothetical protein